MIIRLFTVLLAVILFGCSGNFNLGNVNAGEEGALVDFNVLQFDDTPASKAMRPLDESAVNPRPDNYDFSVEEVQFWESSFLDNGSQAPSVRLVANNRGYAPVSVTISYVQTMSENVRWDSDKFHTLVVPPRTKKEVARFDPINNRTRGQAHCSYVWKIGDYTARHLCREGYRLPFSSKARAHAAARKVAASTSYGRNAVVFGVPAGTQVLAVRKGTVVRINKCNDVDILHDDSTIATYSHLAELAPEIREGKTVTVGEPLGFVEKTEGRVSLGLVVWRPEPVSTGTSGAHEGTPFQVHSFPLLFPDDSKDYKADKRDQPMSSSADASTVSRRSSSTAKKGEYDFSIIDDREARPLFVPESPEATRIIAVNRGYSPVSVILDLNPKQTENINPDVSLPRSAVVLPQSEMVLARLSPLDAQKGMRYGFISSWQLGDYTTRHRCPEKYRFPFADNVRAYAIVPDPKKSKPSIRYSVQFSLPAGSKVLAARKGRVVRVKKNREIYILHDDSTIATYGHLRRIAKGISAGKRVSTGDMLGVAGGSELPGEAYFHLTVWRPERESKRALLKIGSASNFQVSSLPLEFCSDAQGCKVLTYAQRVSAKWSKKEKNSRQRKKR